MSRQTKYTKKPAVPTATRPRGPRAEKVLNSSLGPNLVAGRRGGIV